MGNYVSSRNTRRTGLYFSFQTYYITTTYYEEFIFLWAIIQACGLIKNLALMVYVTVGTETNTLLEKLEELGRENFQVLVISSIKSVCFFLCLCVNFLNFTHVGY